uniref:Ig-like domain-containing protein n=1 Tax=Amphiprion ocellaris TaxID=80972 RepID=A0AAQ5YVY9_AMPOC
MEGRSAVWLLAVLLLLEALISAEAQNTLKYLEVGGKLVLRPEPVSSRIIGVTWKFNDGIVGEWDEGQELEYSPIFRDRASVDTTTGVLEISNMMKNHSGLYTVEINNRKQSGGHDVRVIKQVPKPVVMITPLTCTKESESCFLSCDGDITDADPVTFYFRKGGGDWEEGEQNITIMNDATTQAVPKFFCRMKNPVGETDSESVDNPFSVGANTGVIVGAIVGSVVGVLVAGAVAGGVAASRHKHLILVTS